MASEQRHRKILDLLETVAIDVESVTRSRHAAAIVYKNTILSIGTNRNVTHPFQKRFATHEDAIWIHAEIDAINKAIKRHGTDLVKRSSLYVLRVKHEGNCIVRANSRPCSGCQQAIATFEIRNVFYTMDNGFDYL